MKRLLLTAIVIGWGLAGICLADDEEDVRGPKKKGRPTLQIQNDIPMAYLLGTGQFEATLSFPIANNTLDLWNNNGTALVDQLLPSTGNAGYPTSMSGKCVRAILGTGETVNFLARVGRDSLKYMGGDLQFDYQTYGFRIILAGETKTRPATTIEYDYHLTQGRRQLGTSEHRLVLNMSKFVGQSFVLHGVFGFTRGTVNALDQRSPAPQLGLPLGFFGYQKAETELGAALTWIAGENTDVHMVYEHFGINREIDFLIPLGGRQDPDRFFVEIVHAVNEHITVNLKVQHESDQFSQLYSFLYNPLSAEGFAAPFGWTEFGVTYRGNLTGRD
jgi:hypothetical protein